jgi:predicted nucleic acid-binding protein
MIAVDRLYLDTNVFIAMAEGTEDVSRKLYAIAGAQLPGDRFLFTSELSLAELLVHPIRQRNDALAQLYENWITDGGWLSVGPVDREVLEHAAHVRAQYASTKLPDAIHLSTAIGFGCSHFLTADNRLPEALELWRTKWGVTKGPARLNLLRLEMSILEEIVQVREAPE